MDIWDYLSISLIQNMFMATVCACILCGVIGTYVVVNRMVAVTGGIAHTTFGGIGFSYYVMSVFLVGWFTPMLGALLFGVVSAIIMTFCKKISDLRQDTLIGALWAVGMAMGVIFLCFMDRSVVTPSSYESILFGNVLFVSNLTLMIIAAVTVIILTAVALLFRDLQILTFDETHAKISGINVFWLNMALYVMVAVTCVMVANVVGIIMIIALMTIPVAISNFYTYDLKGMMIVGTVISMVLSILGLFLAIGFDSPPGATVVLIIGIALIVALCINYLSKRSSKKLEKRSGLEISVVKETNLDVVNESNAKFSSNKK